MFPDSVEFKEADMVELPMDIPEVMLVVGIWVEVKFPDCVEFMGAEIVLLLDRVEFPIKISEVMLVGI